jgi:hypothetical protein
MGNPVLQYCCIFVVYSLFAHCTDFDYSQKDNCHIMDTKELKEVIELGKTMGYDGDELKEFVKTKGIEAVEKENREREREKTRMELERERENAAREERMLEREREKTRMEHEERQMDKQIELQKTKEHNANDTTMFNRTTGGSRKAQAPKLPVFNDTRDDLDAYLNRFERFATAQQWPEEDWATDLSALLTGRALETFYRLPIEQANDYTIVKSALLQRYQLTEEGFRNMFYDGKPKTGETGNEYMSRLDNYLTRWMTLGKIQKTYEELRDLVVREQFLRNCDKDITMYLREKNLDNSKKVSELADRYLQVHGCSLNNIHKRLNPVTSSATNSKAAMVQINPKQSNQSGVDNRRCFNCSKIGHISNRCPMPIQTSKFYCIKCKSNGHTADRCRKYPDNRTNPHKIHKSAAVCDFEDTDCENAAGCILNVTGRIEECIQDGKLKLCNGFELPVISGACTINPILRNTKSNMPIQTGRVGNQEVTTLRDTGCSSVVVKSSLVEPHQMTGKANMCILIDGTTRKVPLARIDIQTPFYTGNVEAMCMKAPLYDLIIGNIPHARDPNNPDENWDRLSIQIGQSVTTRKQAEEERKAVKSLLVPPELEIETSVDALKKEQKEDHTLNRAWIQAHSEEPPKITKGGMSWFEVRKGLLYRRYKHTGLDIHQARKQLAIPTHRRDQVLMLAHESALGGHLGITKTIDRIGTNFYWPSMQTDVIRFIRSCDICQRTIQKGRVGKATLEQMPIIDTPFKRIAIDLIGPIYPLSDRKHRYILSVIDYATRYPEAIPLKGIDTITVAEALFEVYSRVGIPEEVLSDLGTQFTSDLMKEISRLLSIKQLTTTPYHPICNGLVERFNGTLKQILKKLCAERPKDWDRYLPAVLFAYREAKQESLAFSPFELLYGRTVRGPMDILRNLWSKDAEPSEIKTTYQYVLDLRNKLEETCKLAHEEFTKARFNQKKIYDSKAKDRKIIPGNQVLIMLPTDHNKLLMTWKGPFKVEEQVRRNDFRIKMGNKTKIFHINMLKQYHERNKEQDVEVQVVATAVVEPAETTEEEELLAMPNTSSKENYTDVHIGPELTTDQEKELRELIKSYKHIFTELPGCTTLEKHNVVLTTDAPVRSRPYPLPYAMREIVQQEIDTMLEMDVIEKSDSPYASPIVLIKKSDGTNRFCIDFRKLNKVTVFDGEPMPTTEDIFSKLQDDKFFSKLDFSKGYWQIPMNEKDIHKTAFVTHNGNYHFKKMPFGMINATATFTRMMRKLLDKLANVDNYVDDVLEHTILWRQHMVILAELFQRISQANLTIRPTKCFFGFTNVSFIGHTVSDGQIQPHPDKIEQIQNAECPKTKKQVRSFLGMIGFYRKYMPNFAAIAVPLTDLTKKGKSNQIIWEDSHEKAFQELKGMLIREPILKLPDFREPFILQADASDTGIGAVLMQNHDGEKFPIAYASKKLLPRERAYSVIERECLALVWAIRKFQTYLYGKEFLLQTDHQPLVYLDQCKVSNSRIMRWALFLQNYRFQIRSIKGTDNVADYMSRIHS